MNNKRVPNSGSEDIISGADVVLQMRQASLPSSSYFMMLGLAALIAAFGLIADSAPAIIGAMVVAPLMSPIMSLAYGLIAHEKPLISASLISIICGIALVIVTGYLVTELLGLRIVGAEILARTAPTFIDLGVAVAAGAAGAFVSSRRSIANSIAGVAIAVALVPPLAVTGIGLAMGHDAIAGNTLSLSIVGLHAGGSAIAYGAFVLFLTNFVGIIFISVLVFYAQRYGGWQRALVAVLLCFGCALLLFKPLNQAFRTLHLRDTTVRAVAAAAAERPDILPRVGKLEPARITYRNGVPQIYLQLLGPKISAPQLQEGVDLIHANIRSATEYPVVLALDYIGIDLLQVIADEPLADDE